MGTPEFAVPSLEILLKSHYDVPAVVTAPDKPRGRGQQISSTPVQQVAVRHGLRVLQPESLREESFSDEIRSLCPDLIIVVAFRILPKEVFMIPPLGSFNLHASLLPKYRGAAPINWAIINGETETGVTTFFLEEKVDTGNTLLQRSIPIGPEDDAGVLHDRLAVLGADVVLNTVKLIERGTVQSKPQAGTGGSSAPKIFKEDCRIAWGRGAWQIHNRVRGLSPFPAAFTLHQEKIIKLFRTQVLETPSSKEPGTIDVTTNSLSVHTRDRMLSILELQLEGKKRLRVDEFLRGYPIRSGDRLP